MKSTEMYETEIVEIIEKENLFFITDIFAHYTGCTRSTFYAHGLDKSDTVMDALDKNKVIVKNKMMSKWANSDNATLQLALFKVLASDEERRCLSLTHTDITSNARHTIQADTMKPSVLNVIIEGQPKYIKD